MDNADFFSRHFQAQPVMAIFRNKTPDRTVELCKLAWNLGIELVEIPVQSPDAIPSLHAAIVEARTRGKIVGAGTVTTIEQLIEVTQMGAACTVAPGLDDDVARESARLHVPHLPGIATATEITRAVRQGFSWLKAFAASQLGPRWIEAHCGPFPEVQFVATGEINTNNAGQFLAAGCGAVSLGSAFTPESTLAFLDHLA